MKSIIWSIDGPGLSAVCAIICGWKNLIIAAWQYSIRWTQCSIIPRPQQAEMRAVIRLDAAAQDQRVRSDQVQQGQEGCNKQAAGTVGQGGREPSSSQPIARNCARGAGTPSPSLRQLKPLKTVQFLLDAAL